MPKDQILHKPRLARSILIAGAIIHFALCWPLYGRRGYADVDPFWLAMIWLWVPWIVISAVHTRLSRKRMLDLLLYVLVTGFSVSWGTVFVRPSCKTPVRALWDLTQIGPLVLVGVVMVEAMSHSVLMWLRRFPPKPGYCESCGYNLYGLPEPRCPECGTSFPPTLLDPDYQPVCTPVLKRRTTWLAALVLVATIAFPFAYRAHAFNTAAVSGRNWAEEDWASGTVTWYVTRAEEEAMTEAQQVRFYELLWFEEDPSTGFRIKHMRQDWDYEIWQSSYREVIEQKLRESGRTPPSFD